MLATAPAARAGAREVVKMKPAAYERIASRILARLEVTRPAEEETRPRILRHELECERYARRRVVGDTVEVVPGRAVVLDVDVQRRGTRLQTGHVGAMVEAIAPKTRSV